jgi:hypothetical protein
VLTRQKEFLQWLVGGFATSAVIVGGVWLGDNHTVLTAQLFGPTSTTPVNPAKSDVLNSHSEASVRTERKASGNMQITLTSTDGRKSDGSLSIQANVTAIADLADLKYEWVLPDGATVASGALTGSFGSVAEGSQVTAALTAVVPSSNSHIVFHAYREMAGEKVGQVAQYNTVDQSSINLQLALKREEIQRKPAMTDRRYE